MERAFPPVESEKIQIFSLDDGRKPCSAIRNDQMPCNFITEACIERLKEPWTRFLVESKYKLNNYVFSPLGISQLTWIWEGCSSTRASRFVVVDNAPCEVILGIAEGQKPRISSKAVNPIYAVIPSKEAAEKQKVAGQEAELRNAAERAAQDAKDKENREKARQERKEREQRTNSS